MTKQLVVDWYNDSNYGKAGCDVTARLQKVTCQRGRDYASQLVGRSIAGQLTATLNNTSGDYSSFNGASPLTGKILPGRKIQLREAPPFGYYVTFDGSKQNIACGSAASIDDIFDAWGTVEAWIYVESDGGADVGRIFDKGVWALITSAESGSVCRLIFTHACATTAGTWQTDQIIPLNTWTHVAVGWNASDPTTPPFMYINTVAVALTETSTPVGARTTDASYTLYVGNNSAGERGFDGNIDEVRLWSDLRLPQELIDNYLKELIGTEADLQLYYQFYEGGGETAHDRTANANDGTASALWGWLYLNGSLYPYYPGGRINAGSGAEIDNLFAGGGSFETWLYNLGVEDRNNYVAYKTNWYVALTDPAVGSMKIAFWRDFDGAADGLWKTTAVQISRWTWTHVAITYNDADVANDPIIYVNGASVAITEVTTPVGSAVADAAASCYMGSDSIGAYPSTVNITDVRLWGDIRSAAEVLANYQSRLAGSETDLELYYKCGDGSGITVTDTGPNGYHGTVSGYYAWGISVIVPSSFGWGNSTYWCGYLKSLIPRPSVNGLHIAVLEAVGPLAQIASGYVNLAQSLAVSTGDVQNAALTAAGWDANMRVIDTGVVTIERVLPDMSDALTLMRDIEDTEAGFLNEDPGGRIRFEARNHRSIAPHTTSQAIFSDAVGDGNLRYLAISQEDPLLYLFNDIQVYAQSLAVGSLAVLWTCPYVDSAFAIPTGETVELWAEYPNPSSANNAVGVSAWTTPAATTDYVAGSTPGGSDKTAQVAVTATKYATKMHLAVTNNDAATVYITLLQARGTPVTQNNPVLVKASSIASQTKYGIRTYNSSAKYLQSRAQAQDWCDDMLALYKDPRPVITMGYQANRDATHGAKALALDISDRVTLIAGTGALLGINQAFFIEAVAHEIYSSGLHNVVYKLTPA